MVTDKDSKPAKNAASVMGRIPLLNPLTFKALVEATTNGLPRKAVAQVAGLAYSTLMKYLAKGRRQDERLSPPIFAKWLAGNHTLTQPQRKQVLVDLIQSLLKARGAAIKRNVEVIQAAALGRQVIEKRTIQHKDGSTETIERHAPGVWQAAAWWLERCEPDDFGRKDKTETTVKTDGGHRGAAILIVDGPEKVAPPPE